MQAPGGVVALSLSVDRGVLPADLLKQNELSKQEAFHEALLSRLFLGGQ